MTLKEQSEGIYKEKGSKFIAYAAPCSSEEEAKIMLHEWRKAHHQARHLCYAYRFDLDKSIYRVNDDGEPSNSAGQPILGQIQSFDLTNVLVGVVRYFGGKKLGVGGLITAYKTAAKEALLSGNIIEVQVYQNFRLTFQYENLSEIMSICKQTDSLPSNQQYIDSQSVLDVAIPLSKVDELKEKIKLMPIKLNNLGIY